jgi:hypothetical protein
VSLKKARESQREARRDSGFASGVVKHRLKAATYLGLKPFATGKRDGGLFVSLGEGTFWEEAFAEADRLRETVRLLKPFD